MWVRYTTHLSIIHDRQMDIDESYTVLEHCRESALFHFQGWKGNYYSFNAQSPPLDAHALLVSEFGLVPFTLPRKSPHSGLGLADFGTLSSLNHHHGRLSVVDIAAVNNVGLVAELIPRYRSRRALLDYCVGFSHDLRRCTCSIWSHSVSVTKAKRALFRFAKGDVTLVTAAPEADYHSGSLDLLLDSWEGPRVVVLYRWPGEEPAVTRNPRQDCTVIFVVLPICALDSLVSPMFTLLNMGLDVTASATVCVSPARVVFERSAAVDLKRSLETLARTSSRPPALIIPVFVATFGENYAIKFKPSIEDFMNRGRESWDSNGPELLSYPSRLSYASDQPDYLRSKPDAGLHKIDIDRVRRANYRLIISSSYYDLV
jgi:hypothetical protein